MTQKCEIVGNDSIGLGDVLGTCGFLLLTAGALVLMCAVYYWFKCKDTCATPKQRLAHVRGDYILEMDQLMRIRTEVLREMAIGLDEADSTPKRLPLSSLKMLGSNVFNTPNGEETGVFYTLDWGGSNYRVLRIELKGRCFQPETSELKTKVLKMFQVTDNAQVLFDFLAQKVKEHMETHGECNASKPFPVGFTFSFPMIQPQLNKGILLNWTKGYNIPGVVGKDVSELMHAAFERLKLPLRIEAVCNDTVATLLACAYEHSHCKVGVIIGTGTNAAYVEPRSGEIVNIEWGAFDKALPRTKVDEKMDSSTQHTGEQLAEKMMSGFFLGELVRILAVDVFDAAITELPSDSRLRNEWGFGSELVSEVLGFDADAATAEYLAKECQWTACSCEDACVFNEICQLIVRRSADLTAAMLSAVMERTGLLGTEHGTDGHCEAQEDDGHRHRLTVAFDGSVFRHVPGYRRQLKATLCRILGEDIGNNVQLVHAEDGSGKGAALAAAAQLHARASTLPKEM